MFKTLFTFVIALAASFFVLLFGQFERLSASAEAFAGSAFRAETTSTQSSAERW